MTEDSIRYVARKNAYDACKEQIEILQSRIRKNNKDIEQLNMEIANELVTPKKNGNTDEEAPVNNERNEGEKFDDESEYDPFEDEGVNGHEGVDVNRILNDDEVQNAEEFD